MEHPLMCCGHKHSHKLLFVALKSDVCLRCMCAYVVKCVHLSQGLFGLERGSLPSIAEVIHCCPPTVAPCPLPHCLGGCGSDSVPRCCASYRPRVSCQALCARGWKGPPAETAALSMHRRGKEDLEWWHSKEKKENHQWACQSQKWTCTKCACRWLKCNFSNWSSPHQWGWPCWVWHLYQSCQHQ